jgi:hypothetical protein
MDTEDPATATKVWRWNINGLGYSKAGINGPYGLAMTMDGAIVANFITTGVLDAALIKTGAITSTDGKVSIGIDSGTGVNITGGALTVKNGNNEVVIDGQYNMHKIIMSGTIEMTLDVGVNTGRYELYHNLGYKPACSCYMYYVLNGVLGQLPFMTIGFDKSSNQFKIYDLVECLIASDRLVFDYTRDNTFLNSASTIRIKYYIYKEVAI